MPISIKGRLIICASFKNRADRITFALLIAHLSIDYVPLYIELLPADGVCRRVSSLDQHIEVRCLMDPCLSLTSPSVKLLSLRVLILSKVEG